MDDVVEALRAAKTYLYFDEVKGRPVTNTERYEAFRAVCAALDALASLSEAQPEEGLVGELRSRIQDCRDGQDMARLISIWNFVDIHAGRILTALSCNHTDEALEMARRDSEYYEGAKAYAAMYEQNPEAARKWLLDGCGDRAASYARALKEPKP